MPASHHSLSLTPLRVLACLALLSVVAAGIAITVILSQSTNPMFSIRREVIVPDLSGMDWQQAQVEQSAAQLSIVWDTRYSAQAEGIVIAQKPTEGSTVKQGQKLILSVSKGPNTITVPDLKSQNRSDAIQTLRDAGFTVSVDYIRNDPTLQADTVILQSPAAGTALEAGDCITLTVARAVPDPFRQAAVPAGHVGRRSAPPPCHCGAAAHSDPLQSDRGHHHRAGSPARHPFAPQRPCAACYKIVCRSIVQNQFSLEKSKKILDFPLPYAIINEHLRLGAPPTACELNKMRW